VVTEVVERLTPSVASLRVWRSTGRGRGEGSGSAVVIAPDGAMVTSAHVVAGSDRGSATFGDGSEVSVEVVGADPLSDLAVVRASDGVSLRSAELGDASTLKVGQLVIAIGNPLGFGGSVSAGIVSALGRSLPARSGRVSRLVESVIQTDAALHPGNSGGALADGRAMVVGINTAVVGPGVGQGLGLAVPVNADGRVRRAYLGIAGGPRPLPPKLAAQVERERGVEVVQVVDGSPAALAGMRTEDIILDIDGTPVVGMDDLQRLMDGGAIGRTIPVRIHRAGAVATIEVTPAELRS
jgi:S1-C subfamily serine protease